MSTLYLSPHQDALNYVIMSRPAETTPHDPVTVFYQYLDKARQQASGASDVSLEPEPIALGRGEKALPPSDVALQVRASPTRRTVPRGIAY